MKFTLLTHARELNKPSNTGQLVKAAIPETEILVWQRTSPDEALLERLNKHRVALVYPASEPCLEADLNNIDECILIDSTWQEARKIYNHSPYLHHLPRVQLHPQSPSRYRLRRNQIEGGLSTVESVIAILQQLGEGELVEELQGLFDAF